MIGLALVKSIIPFSFLISLPERNPPKKPKMAKKKRKEMIFCLVFLLFVSFP